MENGLPRLNLTEEQTRALILEKAHGLFAQYGYNKTTVADIANACGFSSASVYRHFSSKSAINEAMADLMLKGMIAVADTAMAERESATDKLTAMIESLHAQTVENFSGREKMHETLLAGIEEKWDAILQYRSALLERATALVRLGVDQGEFHVTDIEQAALGLHMSLKRLFHPLVVVDMLDEPDAGSVPIFLDFAFAALGAARSDQ